MNKIEAVQAIQNFIETHISEEISLVQLAGAAHFSLWNLARIFK